MMKRTYKLIHGFVFATVITTAVQAQSPNWTVNPGGFNNSMNVTSVANVACVELTNNANKIAAFVGAECRGVVNTSTDANGRKLAFLLVYSNTTSGEKVKFKIYDSNTNTVYDSKDSLVFSNNASYGTVSLPYIVSTNHAPTAIALANSTVSENSAINTIVGGLSASDPDNNFAPVFTMDPSGINSGEFNVSGSNLRTSLSFNFEAASTKSIAIKVSDGGGCSYVKTFQISILDANDTPSEISLSNSTVEENQPVGTLVGNFSSIDEDVSNTHTYALVSGTGSAQNSYFNITNNQLVTSAILNHEQLNSYSIRVRTTDNGSAFFEKVFVISTIDVNDLPTNVLLSNNTIDENQSVSSFVGILSSTDEDIADVHSYSLVVGSGSTHNSYFAISGGNLVTDSVLNFESISTYNIRLRSTDLSGTFYEENFTINANDLNDTPTDITLSFKLIQEQQPVGTFIGKFSTTDEDANDTHVYTLASGTGDTHNAKFTIKDDSLKAAEVFYFIDFDTLKIRLRATDLAGAFVEKEFAIIVVDVNDQPTDMLLVGISVNENSSIKTYIGKLTTSDVDTWDSHTYSLVDGIGDENNDYFSVKNDSLLIDSVMNFELNNNLKLRIRTTDLFGLFIEKTFNITVNDLNEAPELIADTFFISEDAQLATIIGKVTFYEEDSNQDHIFTLVDNVTPFEIDSLSGNVSLFKSELDYENIDSVYTILVQVKDNGTPFLTDTLSYRIIVRDAIEGLLPCTHFISPNSDGKNDFWKIENVFLYENFEVLIFNDNGQLVFQKEKAYNNEFDGKFNGNNLPDGVYYYALNNKENGLKFKGIITIIN